MAMSPILSDDDVVLFRASGGGFGRLTDHTPRSLSILATIVPMGKQHRLGLLLKVHFIWAIRTMGDTNDGR